MGCREATHFHRAGWQQILESVFRHRTHFLYVEDAASAYLAIADRLDRDEVRGQAFNAGGERPYTVLEIVGAITRLAGTGLEPVILGSGNPDGEIDRQFVDASRLRDRCGWEPEVTLEANPSTLERARLPGFRAAGVSRPPTGVESVTDGGPWSESADCSTSSKTARKLRACLKVPGKGKGAGSSSAARTG